MPKPFSEQEKDVIRAQLLDKGKRLIEKHRIKKTSIDDIVDAVGISKGAFYFFFESKEELLLALIQDFRIPEEAWESSSVRAADHEKSVEPQPDPLRAS